MNEEQDIVGKRDRHSLVKQLASSGLTNETIARQLGLSEGTVENYKKKTLVRPGVPLTGREQQIYDLAGQGLNSDAIGDQLGLSPRTVELHRFRAMKKLGVRTAAGLVALHKSKDIEAVLAEVAELKLKVAKLEEQLAAVLTACQ